MGSVLGGLAHRRPPPDRCRTTASRRSLMAGDGRARARRWAGCEALRGGRPGDQTLDAAETTGAAATVTTAPARCQEVGSGRHRHQDPTDFRGLVVAF